MTLGQSDYDSPRASIARLSVTDLDLTPPPTGTGGKQATLTACAQQHLLGTALMLGAMVLLHETGSQGSDRALSVVQVAWARYVVTSMHGSESVVAFGPRSLSEEAAPALVRGGCS